MAAQNKNRSESGAVEKTQRPFKSFSVVLMEWLARFGEIYRQPLSPLAVKTYEENLSDLSAEQLDAACRHALRISEFMPTVATIRKSFNEISYDEQRHERPAYLDEPPLSEEEREEALRFSKKLKDALTDSKGTAMQQRKKRRIAPRQSTLSLEEQKKILREKGFIN